MFENNVAFLPWGDAWIWKPFRNPSTWIVSELLTHRERSCDAEGGTRWRNASNKSCKSEKKNYFERPCFLEKGADFFCYFYFFFLFMFSRKAFLCLCFCLFIFFYFFFCILDFGSIPSFHPKVWHWIL
jgi:hypothetical protein